MNITGQTAHKVGRSLSLFVMIPLSIISLVAQGVMALAIRREARRNSQQYRRRLDIEDAVRRRMQRSF
jgi:hypothetical protein